MVRLEFKKKKKGQAQNRLALVLKMQIGSRRPKDHRGQPTAHKKMLKRCMNDALNLLASGIKVTKKMMDCSL